MENHFAVGETAPCHQKLDLLPLTCVLVNHSTNTDRLRERVATQPSPPDRLQVIRALRDVPRTVDCRAKRESGLFVSSRSIRLLYKSRHDQEQRDPGELIGVTNLIRR